MNETTANIAGDIQAKAKLYGALAKLQADLPRVVKDATADAGTYKYNYADLAAVTDAVMPRLGKLGLAFVALPTINGEGRFVLAYSLVHEAGAEMTGEYMLPDKGNAQSIGSAITYARRYSLCAVTGIAPAGEDDDGAAAGSAYDHSAGDAWAQSSPARTRQPANGSGQPRGQVSRPAQPSAAAPPDGEVDEAAQEYANQAHEARTLADLEKIHKDARETGRVTAVIRNPASGKTGKLAIYLDWRRKQLKEADDALNELNAAADAAQMPATAVDEHVQATTGTDLESATPAQLREAARALRKAAA